jgi:hypothetical protein
MTEAGWEAVTYSGARAGHARAMAGATGAERLRMLDGLLDLAEAGGGLARVRRQRQAAVDRMWRQPASRPDETDEGASGPTAGA